MPDLSALEQPIPILNIPLWQALLIGAAIFIIYLIITRKPRVKEFKPLDIKKETKKRFDKEYKYFGKSLGKPLFDAGEDTKPIAFVIGFMKVIEMKRLKRLEPIWVNPSKEQLQTKHEQLSIDIYDKSYSDLNEVEKKNIDEVARDEIKNEKIETSEIGTNQRIVRGKLETMINEPVPMYALKICGVGFLSKIFARLFNIGTDWIRCNENQVTFYSDRLQFNITLQRRLANNIFVTSSEAMKSVQDISFGAEREAIWQETANQIPRAVHFDTEASKQLVYRREDAKIEKEKRRPQSEMERI